MADEKKTYLIDVESNLKEYADAAAEAKKKVDALKDSNDALVKSGKATASEIEASKAALKNANAEYSKAQKMVQLQIAANSSETGSRKQLSEILKLQEQALGKLGSAYVKSAQGLDVLNPKYKVQQDQIAATKQKIIQYDQALNDGRSNIGRYGDSVKAAFSEGAKSIMSMISPMALVTAAIALGKKVLDGLKDAIMSTSAGIDIMNQMAAQWKQLMYDIVTTGKMNKDNLEAISVATKVLNKLRVEEMENTGKISVLNREEQLTREQAVDQTKSHSERLALYLKVKDLEHQKTQISITDLGKELEAQKIIAAARPKDEKQRLIIIDLQNKINDAIAEEAQAMRRVDTQISGFEEDEIKARQAVIDWWTKASEDDDKDAAERAEKRRKAIYDQGVAAEKEAQTFVDAELKRMDKEAEDKWNAEVEFQRKLYDSNKKAGQDEYNLRVKQEEALAEATLRIQKELAGSRMNLAKSVSNFFNSIAGENKVLQDAAIVADGAMAIAEVIIKTTQANAMIRATAAASVLPGPGYLARLGISMAAAMAPINLNRIAAGIDIAAIIAAMSGQIKSNNQSTSSTSSSTANGETSIVVQRNFAQQTGSTILTQPQLTQPQLNSIQSAGSLSADDIARALAKMPAPVVSVEKIEAQIKSKRKVDVRANI